ncbi:MAG: histidine triad nucleotide-binding protein [Candidatus Margulisiibacteriota bacterium]|nr:histidine triad nucleotide-binding protein [Candidatus Margulisiibacteriota bacterium]
MDCIFCKIVRKEIPAEIVFEDNKVLAFKDINPQAPHHILFIPKEHVTSVADLENIIVISDLFAAMKQVAQTIGIDKSGYRIVVNHGKEAGQAVPHLHFHLLGGRPLKWPPG